MNGVKRSFVAACTTILLCITLIVGGTFALFTDTKQLTTHLQAGKLQATLTRTKLTSYTLNSDGLLEENVDTVAKDFTNNSKDNVFGVVADETLIVPLTYFEAEMLLENNDNVAFDYSFAIVIPDTVDVSKTELEEQLLVTVTVDGKEQFSELLSADATELATGTLGTLVKGGSVAFTVKVEFIDDSSVNNNAMSDSLTFDLMVYAVQNVPNK